MSGVPAYLDYAFRYVEGVMQIKYAGEDWQNRGVELSEAEAETYKVCHEALAEFVRKRTVYWVCEACGNVAGTFEAHAEHAREHAAAEAEAEETSNGE